MIHNYYGGPPEASNNAVPDLQIVKKVSKSNEMISNSIININAANKAVVALSPQSNAEEPQ